ncbi:hypothetical protein PMA3_11390 [Pseudomonas silesiensis]|uniref:Immunity protein 43 domain-containing protein n=1 Tax=Pseudomonas silesiensis TaxID=1853130 RepID=A0A191YSH5_9PSED|nr:hypothetical protein [Pseudomonas silesiensis]ANJ55719.1 hypothetical protein PMA3_11390 [Pseudomonas silesiensis]
MYIIGYKGGEDGCPENSIYGELVGYNWNSNDFADKKFPSVGTILDFYAQHRIVDSDFFYFGSEFICSEFLLRLIIDSSFGSVDIRDVRLHQQNKAFPLASKKYYLLRSREVHKILDMAKSTYEFRFDPVTKTPEEDAYHSGRLIFDLISDFQLSENLCPLDIFVASEMLKDEYVISDALAERITECRLKGVNLTPLSKYIYDAKLEF